MPITKKEQEGASSLEMWFKTPLGLLRKGGFIQMKKKINWKKYAEIKRGKLLQAIVSLVIILGSIGIAIANLAGYLEMSESKLLNIIILLLCGIGIIYVVEEVDVFEEIRMQVSKLPDKVENVKNEIFENEKKELKNVQDEMKNIKSGLDEVHELLKDADTPKVVIQSRRELEKNKSLDEVWSDADEVYLLAIANTGFLRGNGIIKIKEAVNRGVKFKLVSLNPDYDAINEYEASNIISPTSIPVNENINAYISNCNNSKNNRNKQMNDFKTMVEFKLTTYLLPYSMMIVKKDGKINTIKVDLYGVDIEYTERRSFYIPADDEENIKFYEDQWNSIWENKRKTISVDITKTY